MVFHSIAKIRKNSDIFETKCSLAKCFLNTAAYLRARDDEEHGVEMGKSFHLQRGLKMSRLAE